MGNITKKDLESNLQLGEKALNEFLGGIDVYDYFEGSGVPTTQNLYYRGNARKWWKNNQFSNRSSPNPLMGKDFYRK